MKSVMRHNLIPMIQKSLILCFCLVISLNLHTAFVFAQSSIIDKIIKSQSAIVSITSDISGLFKSPQVKPFIDAQTGRVGVLRNLARGYYHRNGAGVIIHSSGVIVTNAHTVAKATHIKVHLHDGRQVPAQVVRFVSNLDFALLKIPSPSPMAAIPIADSDEIHLGDEIITVGNSPLLSQTMSGGKIIGLGTSRPEKNHGNTRTDLIQTTINLYQGDSGGPLFDQQGRLIGLMTAKETSANHSSFAIPSNKIREYLMEYLDAASSAQQ